MDTLAGVLDTLVGVLDTRMRVPNETLDGTRFVCPPEGWTVLPPHPESYITKSRISPRVVYHQESYITKSRISPRVVYHQESYITKIRISPSIQRILRHPKKQVPDEGVLDLDFLSLASSSSVRHTHTCVQHSF